ncbi:MAG: glycosyl hydrolase [Pirellulales bacterium]
MTRARSVMVLVLGVGVWAGAHSRSDDAAPPWPPITREAKPWTRWWWLGSAVDEPGLKHELAELAEAGFGGVEITPIYGARGAEDRFLQFLSPDYMRVLELKCQEAKRLGLGVDMATGTGWPFGGPHVGPDDVELRIAGKDGRFAPQPTGFKVKRAAPGAAGFVVNPYSTEAIKRYLQPFTEAFGHLSPGGLRSQFHDSFEYQANWVKEAPEAFLRLHGYPLDSQLDALEGRGDLETVARVKADYRTMLATLHLAYVREWVEWAHRAGCLTREQAHGAPANLIDLYALSDIPETEVFGASEFAIPGLRREQSEVSKNLPQPLVTRLASSAAHLAGRRLVSSETFTWMREHFCEAPSQMKPEIDQLFLAGINHIFYHGTAYSPEDVAWPGWLFYASTQANDRNPLWRELVFVNAYVARSQALLQASAPDNDLLIYWPIHDLYHSADGWQRAFSMHHRDWLTDAESGKLAQELLDEGLSFDFCSDALLREAGRYRAVVVPPCRLMPVDTLQSLLDHAEHGGRVLFVGQMPTDVPGLGRLAERRAAFQEQLGRLSWKPCAGGQQAVLGEGSLTLVADVEGVIDHAGARVEPAAAAGLSVLRRRFVDGSLYFFVNEGPALVDAWVGLAASGPSGLLMDARTGEVGRAAMRTDAGQSQVRLLLSPGESVFLKVAPDDGEAQPPWSYAVDTGEPVVIEGEWRVSAVLGGPELPPAFTSVTVDSGQAGSLASWTEQGGEWARFAGTARYDIEFELEPDQVAKADDWRLDLGNVREVARVQLNGHDIDCVWSLPFSCRLDGRIQAGRNRLSIEVTNLAANRIRDLDACGVAWKNFHEINFVDVHYQRFDASAWPLKPSGLLGPVRLVPLTTR